MNRHTVFAAWLAALATVMPLAAGAADVAQCQADIKVTQTGLDDAFNSGAFLSRNAQRDYDSLGTKLSYASQKLDLGKYADAIQKLEDFNGTVQALVDAAKPKLEAAAGATLIQDASDAIACIQTL